MTLSEFPEIPFGQHFQKTILIVDDSALNRMILLEMLEEEYNIIEACDGEEAIKILKERKDEIDLVLLDIVMPKVDGFGVLAELNNMNALEDIPVIMISAETANAYVKRAYDLGASDFINRPFDPQIVQRRISNTIVLYSKQKKLVETIAEQIYDREESNSVMVSILSHIVEFRNGESGLHVLHIKTLTGILLKRLLQKTDKYELSKSEIDDIIMASSMHDIGKIAIPEGILNKPGRFTPEEYEIMKGHSMAGAQMMEGIPYFKSVRLVKYCYEICRWHHERYDGKGYPDGIAGDAIPISAQVVSLADVYDALTSKRCYKDAYTQEKALEMIQNGECGTFNPLLIECLLDAKDEIAGEMNDEKIVENHAGRNLVKDVFDDIRHYSNSPTASNAELDEEKVKNEFLSGRISGMYFEYDKVGDSFFIVQKGAEIFGIPMTTIHPAKSKEFVSVFDEDARKAFYKGIKDVKPSYPNAEFDITLKVNGRPRDFRVYIMSIWRSDEVGDSYTSLFGEVTEL